ncbi:phosphorylase b kinase regulatory [Trichuris trichiura]|uniref:Phosphorylase b kinase regulatory subunit n=1 Tax=Trichuris trichiura TaxID=36087 RepID=A0A077ZC79_TRITR|nr:phosphorylase b kinase regulatory [Trichuris trichiura]
MSDPNSTISEGGATAGERRKSYGLWKPALVYSSPEKISCLAKLEFYYNMGYPPSMISHQLLRYQSSTSGLFPQLSSDAKVGHVRDSVYCAMACWALSMAYKKLNDDQGRFYELKQTAVKTMRGILLCWMRQADKLENFKTAHTTSHALHSKFNLFTGEPLTDCPDYGHLQLDAVALFVFTLVQMITGGLEVIYTSDEISFVQNLVFYIERAYRTPDFGMWELGTRYNVGVPELHASSVGMVKAALESINGCNLYGSKGTSSSIICVDVDAHNRNRTTFETLLPRESNSKNVDASLIPTVSYPCFAAHGSLYKKTIEKCVRRLKGKYGLKRFLRDGKYSDLENPNKEYYDAGETKLFDGVECQWPIFFIYLIIDGIIVPQYYYLPKDDIYHERNRPGSQTFVPSSQKQPALFLWGQALYIIACLLKDKLILISDIDPLYRHLPACQRPKFHGRGSTFQGSLSTPIIQVAMIAESQKLQTLLSTYGITTQTPHQVEPVQIWSSNQLVSVFENIGKNPRMGLTGRPRRPIGALGTSKIYRVFGETVLCYPLLFDVQDFYLSSDPEVLIDDIKVRNSFSFFVTVNRFFLKRDLKFVESRWQLDSRPTYCLLLKEDLVLGEHFPKFLNLLVDMRNGHCDGVRIQVGRLQNLLSSSCCEHLDFCVRSADLGFELTPVQEVVGKYSDVSDYSVPQEVVTDKDDEKENYEHTSSEEILNLFLSSLPTALFKQMKLLEVLAKRHGLEHKIGDDTVRQKLQHLCRQASLAKSWWVFCSISQEEKIVRVCAAHLRKVVDSLAPSITSILVRGKRLTIGVFGHEEVTVDSPVTPNEIEDLLFQLCLPYDPPAAVLAQELIIALGHFVMVEPELFSGILKIRIGWLIHALDLTLFDRKEGPPASSIYSMSPTQVKSQLHDLLSMKNFGQLSALQQRQLNGSLNRVPADFFDHVWRTLERTPGGLLIGDHTLMPQPLLSDMTEYELNFALAIDELLCSITLPEYRQLMVELFVVLSIILQRNPELNFSSNLITEAVSYYAEERNLEQQEAKSSFLTLYPQTGGGSSAYLARAVVSALLRDNKPQDRSKHPSPYDSQCVVM